MKRIIYVLLIFSSACSNTRTHKEYYSNGNLRLTVPIVHGKRHGELIQFYKNGTVELRSEWVVGVKHGKVISYYKNGRIKSREKSVSGVGEGLFKYYDSLGNLVEIIPYRNSKEHGQYYKLYPDSSINVEANFVNGNRHGKALLFDQNGGIQRRMIYVNGQLKYSVYQTEDGGFFNPYLSISVKKGGKNSMTIGLLAHFHSIGMIQRQ